MTPRFPSRLMPHPKLTPQRVLWYVAGLLEPMGRNVLDQLGLSNYLERFEAHFGKRPTRWLLYFITFVVVSVGLGAVGTVVVAPVLSFLALPQWQQILIPAFLAVAALGFGAALSFVFAVGFGQWVRARRHRHAMKREAQRLGSLVGTARTLHEESTEHLKTMMMWMRRITEASSWDDPEDRRRAFEIIEKGERQLGLTGEEWKNDRK